MRKLRMLLANEPRSYRETLAAALQALRPEAEVRAVDPEALDGEVENFTPHLVVSSRVTEALRDEALSWVELYPDHGSLSEVSVGKRHAIVEQLDLADLTSIMDQTENMLREPR